MSKTIPVTLLAHKAQSATTLTDILLVGPLPDDTYRGFCLLDVDVTYDDGNGSVVYKSHTGIELSAQIGTSDLAVDNAEATSLPPVAGFELDGFTQAQVDSGALDKTPFVLYRVNYKDLSQGHEIRAGGTIGEVRTKVGGLTVLELRSLSQQLKQEIGERDSLTCRAKFGSVTGVDARFGCDFDLTTEWVSGAVTGVGGDTDREFTDDSATEVQDYYAPGVVEWLTGDNVGQSREVEGFDFGGAFTLQFPTAHPIQTGDTYRRRRECTKVRSGHNSCETFHSTDWVLHFRGEPWIPVAEAGKINAPGAALASSVSGTGE